ncbi:MAG: hypothetical protein JOZ69_05290 [Myxococcales bacterium]|nr:hypothetical protein [Myxococcales bacterium]
MAQQAEDEEQCVMGSSQGKPAVDQETRASPVNVILWKDIFVVVDNGEGRASDYVTLAGLIRTQCTKYTYGVGCLTIIPSQARPPKDEVRRAMNDVLAGLDKSLRCLCWFVEGAGFQGAMARAVLTGLRAFGRYAFPTHVSSQLDEALQWMLPQLDGGARRLPDVPAAAAAIRDGRQKHRFGRSV